MDPVNAGHGQRLQELADMVQKHSPNTEQMTAIGNPEDNMGLLSLVTSRFFLFTFVIPIAALIIFSRFFSPNDTNAPPPEESKTFVPANKLGKQNQKSPQMQPSEVVSLRIYPIKSCRGIVLNDSKLLRSGLELDRNWCGTGSYTTYFHIR